MDLFDFVGTFEIFSLVFLTVGGLLLLVFVRKRERRRQEGWRRFAGRRGLSFDTKGGEYRRPVVYGEIQGLPFFMSMVSTGSADNRSVRHVTEVGLLHTPPPGFYCIRDNFTFKTIKALVTRDIPTGVPEFDARMIIRGDSPSQIIAYLTVRRRDALLRLAERPGQRRKGLSVPLQNYVRTGGNRQRHLKFGRGCGRTR